MKDLISPTTKKAAMNTCAGTNQNIRKKTVCDIDTYSDLSGEIMENRIEMLDCEWDIERVLETNAAAIVLLSSIMGYAKYKSRWFLLSGTVGMHLLQHALQGWCPTLPILRCMGVRTAEEINNEKTVYKYIRGDFTENTKDADQMLKIAEK